LRSKCVYFTKSNPAKAVDVKTVDSDLLCGEMVGMPLESLQSVITNVYRPLISAQEDWQKCSSDQVFLRCIVWLNLAWYAIWMQKNTDDVKYAGKRISNGGEQI
jgi:uncharacterized membrane protein